MRLAIRRKLKKSDYFKDRYRYRSGVEATMSEYDRLTGVKHLRVRGLKAVRLCATIKALGINIFRITAAVKAGVQAIQTENMAKSPTKTLISAFKKQISSFLVNFKGKLDRNEKMLVA